MLESTHASIALESVPEIKKAPGPPPSVDLFLLVHASSVDDVISEIRSIGVGS